MLRTTNHGDLRHLVLVGGGHSHLAVLRMFAMRPEAGVRITVIARERHTPYSGMLPGLIAGHYGFDDCHIDLTPLARAAGARLIIDEVVALHADTRSVVTATNRKISYDVLSVNCGIAPSTRSLRTGADLVVPVKPIGRFVARWHQLRTQFHDAALGAMLPAHDKSEPASPRQLAIVGGGVAGIEIALAVRHALQDKAVAITLVDAQPHIAPQLPARARQRLLLALQAAGVQVINDETVEAVTATQLSMRSGRIIPAAHVLWATGAAAPGWLAGSGLATDADGFVAVDANLRSVSHANVFAAGDVASMAHERRPKAGVFAVRQGPYLAENLRRALLQKPLRSYSPQRRFLTLVSLADRTAVGARGTWSASGAWLWRWKDWIDRRFVARFDPALWMNEKGMNEKGMNGQGMNRQGMNRTGMNRSGLIRRLTSPRTDNNAAPMMLAPMPARPLRLPDTQAAAQVIHCAGCAAKLGADVLSSALAEVAQHAHPDVVVGLAERDDAAILRADTRPLAITVDGFPALVSDPYLFGRLAVNHALGDVFAMGAEAAGALALVTVPHGAKTLQEADLRNVLAGALAVLTPLGVPLLGGHSAQGAELSVGFTVLGRVPTTGWMSKGGLRPGDALILTKRLGVGALFAAEMRGAARGRWLDAALAEMLQLLADAAQVLRVHGANGCTDVTGFGLLGHASEMARASSVSIEIDVSGVPFLDGALSVVAAGITSSLQPSNELILTQYALATLNAADPRIRLLVDPQTCGGLLAGVPFAQAEDCVQQLRQQGYAGAAVIGLVTSPRPDGLVGALL